MIPSLTFLDAPACLFVRQPITLYTAIPLKASAEVLLLEAEAQQQTFEETTPVPGPEETILWTYGAT